MRAGFGKVDITPYDNPIGAYRLSPIKRHCGIHDPIFCNVLMIEGDAGNRLLIVSADIVGFNRNDVRRFKRSIEERFGLQSEEILICATHNHNGPDTLYEEQMPGFNLIERLEGQVLEAVGQAFDSLQEARAGWGAAGPGDPASG